MFFNVSAVAHTLSRALWACHCGPRLHGLSTDQTPGVPECLSACSLHRVAVRTPRGGKKVQRPSPATGGPPHFRYVAQNVKGVI